MDDFGRLTAVFIGSGVGGVLRYLSGLWIAGMPAHSFPLATLFVNVTGSALIGVLFVVTGSGIGLKSHPMVSAALVTGLCGGFTTFSSFSLQTWQLVEKGQPLSALLNIVASIVLCLSFTALAIFISRTIIR